MVGAHGQLLVRAIVNANINDSAFVRRRILPIAVEQIRMVLKLRAKAALMKNVMVIKSMFNGISDFGNKPSSSLSITNENEHISSNCFAYKPLKII